MENEFVVEVKNIADGLNKNIEKTELKMQSVIADMSRVQESVDAIAAEQKRSVLGGAKEAKATLDTALETKGAELKSYEKGSKPVEIKASVDMLRSNTGESQSVIAYGGTVQIPNRLTHVRDFMRIGKLAQPVYIYDRELPTEGTPGLTAEGARKPRISFSTVAVTANAAKIASHYKLSTELLHDRPAFAYSLQGRGIELTLQEEDYQLLYGAGTTGTVQGVMPLATPFDAGTLRVTNAQNIDVVRAAINQVRLSMFAANVVFMHPTDVAALELTKDNEGRYLLPNILSGAVSTVSRIQIAEIDAINPGEFLVGAMNLAVDTFMVEDLIVKVSDSNEDDFVTNKVTVVIEERLIQAVTRPTALVKGEFESAKAALMAA